MTEKPFKKTKDSQKLTWLQIISRDLKPINLDTAAAIKISQIGDNYNIQVVNRVMTETLTTFFPENGDPRSYIPNGTIP